MPCLNCTFRVLRAFIHGPIAPDFSTVRHGLRKQQQQHHQPLLQRYPRRLPQFPQQQLRRQSTLVTNYDKLEAVATDDDYIPFVGITGHGSPLAAERLIGQMHHPPPPPPPPVPHGSEPEIILKVSEQFGEERVAETEAEAERRMKIRRKEREEKEKEKEKEEKEEKEEKVASSPTMFSAVDTIGEPLRDKRFRKRGEPDLSQNRRGKQERRPRLEALDRQQPKGVKGKKKEKKEKRKKARKKPGEKETGIPELTMRRSGNWDLPPIEGPRATTLNTKLQHHVATTPHREIDSWRIQKAALQRKFGRMGWDPLKKLSPEALDGIRVLHAQHPDIYTSSKLADLFKVSPEVIRRILKSAWQPSPEEAEERNQRWADRGKRIFDKMIRDGTVKTKAMRKKEQKARLKPEAVAVRGRSIPMSDRIF